jgi:Protein of unknown function (DUF2844)
LPRFIKCLAFAFPIRRLQAMQICRWLLLLAFFTPLSAFASLGGDSNSAITDQIHFQASLQTNQTSSFTVHEIHTQNKTVIREYVSPAGTVFAVTWRGPWIPDMQQLLGSHFQQLVNATQAQNSAHTGRHPLNIVQPDFVFEQGGHMRSFAGRAYLPKMLPADVHVEAIQ